MKSFLSRFSEARDLIDFFWQAKMWFFIPFLVLMLVFGFILVFAQASGVAPFIYTLF